MTLVVQSQIFLETTPAQSHWVNLSLGAETSLPCHTGLRRQPPSPWAPLSSPTKPSPLGEVWSGRTPESSSSSQGGAEAVSQDEGIRERHSQQVLSSNCFRTRRAAHLNIHTSLHLKTALLYFKGGRKKKDPPNPFQKNPIIIITIIKNPIRNRKEALRVWVLHSSSTRSGFFCLFVFISWWPYTSFLKKKKP